MNDIKKFLTNSTLYLLVFVLLFVILNQVYIDSILEQKSIFLKEKNLNDFLDSSSNNDYLFLGDSHVREGINPIYFNNSFNYATSGESYIQTYYKILYLDDNDKLNFSFTVINIDLQKFSSLGTEKERILNDIYFYHKKIPLKLIAELKKESRAPLYIQTVFPLLGNGLDIYSFFSEKSEESILGFLENNNNFTGDFTSVDTVTNLHFKNKILFDPLLVDYFEKLLLLLDSNNKEIILVKFPLSDMYLASAQEKGVNISEFYGELDGMLESLNISYTLLDYQDYFSNRTDVFSDSSHLNSDGSRIFSKNLSLSFS